MLSDIPNIIALSQAGFSPEDAREHFTVTGLGTVRAEDWASPYFAPNGRSKRWKLQKRALTDAYRRRFGEPSRQEIRVLRRQRGDVLLLPDMNANIKVAHLIVKVIIEKCTTQLNPGILMRYDIAGQCTGRKEMITVEKKEQIRRAYHVEGKSIRQIQRETGHHRDTIRKALGDSSVPQYTLRKPRPSPVMDPVKPIIDQWLAEDEHRPRKQRHTARRIYDRLRTEYGFEGGESTVRRYVGQRRKRRLSQVFIPLAYEQGQIAQVDFGEAQVVIASEQVTAQLFCLRMGYSKQPFVTALPNQAQEAFFEGHVRAFDFLGGVPRVLVYDNLKVAVKRILEGRNREEQTAFIAFRSHYLFESRFCNPGQGHEKGLTEGLVGYSRRNWLVPPPEHPTWDDLNAYLLEECRGEGERRLRGMEQTIGEALALERSHLLPLPARAFPCCVLRPARANGFGLVTFQTNRYSVPAVHAHEKLWLRAFVDRVEITNGRQVLAVHPRCYRREQDILDPLHYLPLLEQRPGAWDQAKPIQEWRQQWPRVYERYLDALRERLPRSQATREFVHVLQLHEDYPEQIIAQALEEALSGYCYSADGVKQLVLRLIEPPCERAPLEEADGLFIDVSPVAWPDLHQFDRLLSRTGGGR